MKYRFKARTGLFVTLFFLTIIMSKAQNLNGIWFAESYGTILEIKKKNVTKYELTDISCLKTAQFKLEFQNSQAFLDSYLVTIDARSDQLILDEFGYMILAERLTGLPKLCKQKFDKKDPERNFEIYWQTFNDFYAYFDLYELDWQAQYEAYRPKVNQSTSEQELYDILTQMTEPLKDEHVSLNASIKREELEFSPVSELDWVKDFKSMFGVIFDNYLLTEREILANKKMAYGQLSDSVAYLNIAAMGAYHKTLFGGFPTVQQDALALRKALDEIVAELQAYDALVLDLRFNGGGRDAMADLIASYFGAKDSAGFSKSHWYKSAFSQEYQVKQNASSSLVFDKLIVVLTSNFTVSAAESLMLRLRILDHVTIVGEPTAGAFSDILDRQLPNGWSFGLSNERYTSYDGFVFEKIGIQPDELVLMQAEGFADGHDYILEKALEILSK